MFECRFDGRLCVLSRDAINDLQRNGISHFTLREIIEHGEDFRDAKMGRAELGRCMIVKGEVLFTKLVPTYSFNLDEEIWLVKHVGKGKMK